MFLDEFVKFHRNFSDVYYRLLSTIVHFLVLRYLIVPYVQGLAC